MTPSLFQAPPTIGTGASQMVCGRPPLTSLFLSLPAAWNATNRLSGDQNGGVSTPSVPGNARGSSESIRRIHTNCVRPLGPGAMKASARPSGDSVKERLPAGRAICTRDSSARGGLRGSARTTRHAAAIRERQRHRRPRRRARGATGGRREACRRAHARRARDPLQLAPRDRARSASARPDPWPGIAATTSIERRRRQRLTRRRSAAGCRHMIAAIKLAWLLPVERLPARHHFVQHRAEREDVGPRIGLSVPRAARAPCTGTCRGSCPAPSDRAASSAASTGPPAPSGPPDRRRCRLRQSEIEQLGAGSWSASCCRASGRDARCPRGAPCRARRRSAIAYCERLVERQRAFREPIARASRPRGTP